MSRAAPLAALLVAAAAGRAADGPVLLSLDDMQYTAPKAKATAKLVDGKVGKAVEFAFEKDAKGVFFTTNVRGSAAWDEAAGFSFWVKGTGTDGFGGLEFVYDGDYAVRYDLCFPVKGTDWTKVVVAWRDLAPVLAKGKPLDPAGDFKPSKLNGPWVGKWWYWADYPALAFALDDIRLEPKIDRADAKDLVPAAGPLDRVRAKLKAGKPITVVTMGDSLTDSRHWANKKGAWPSLLKDKLEGRIQGRGDGRQPGHRRHGVAAEPDPDPALDRGSPGAGPRDGLLRRQRLERRHSGRGVRRDVPRRRGPRPAGDRRQGRRAAHDDGAGRRAVGHIRGAVRSGAEGGEGPKGRLGGHRGGFPRGRQGRPRQAVRLGRGPPQPARPRNGRRRRAEGSGAGDE